MKRPRIPTAWRFRFRAGVLIGVLCGLLGFALAVQVHSTQSSALPSARQEDLVRILDDLSAREDRLRTELAALQTARDRISSGSDRTVVALAEARKRSGELGVLAGTVPASGPGVVVTIGEGSRHVSSDVLLDALEEIRGAGAEAVQIDGTGASSVRVGAGTWFTDSGGNGVKIDGHALAGPYTFTAIGDGPTMAAALDIPGGVADTVRQVGGSLDVRQSRSVQVTALRALKAPQYARPTK